MELTYREVSCQKSVDASNFVAGVQDYIFSCSGTNAWIPQKSYFRIEMTLNGAGLNGVQPTLRQQLAFADGACNALYDNVYVKANNSDISTLTNYVAQTGAIKNRVQKTGAWLQSVGKSAYMIESDFDKRVSAISRDAAAFPDGQQKRLFIGNAANQLTATVAITAATGAIVGVNTNLLQLAVGDMLVVDGVTYTCHTAPTNALGNAGVVIPFPPADVAATEDAYIIKNIRKDGGQRNKVFALWQPPVGLFDYGGHLGSGEYRVSLNPNTSFKYSAVETRQGTEEKSAVQTVTADSGWDLVINSVKFYVATVKASIPQGITNLYLIESQVQNKSMTGQDQTFDFVVPSSTKALCVFVQSNKAGSNPQFPPTMFKLPVGTGSVNQDLLLESLQISYANQVKPATRWTSAFTGLLGTAGNPSINELQQRYNDSFMEAGTLMDPAGCESFEDFIKRGPFYYFSFERDSADKSTQVQVAAKINFTDLATVGCNLFLVAFYSRAIELTMDGSMVQQVRALAI